MSLIIIRLSVFLKFYIIYINKKGKNPLGLFPFLWVEDGTRTHDIQNHNLTL